jgi:phosphoribosylanthranilate isomerase
MELKTNVKLGEVNNLSDARYAAGVGAAFLGFNFSPSHPQYIAPSQVEEIVGWLTGPALVGEFDNELTDIIRDTAERFHLDYVQLNEFNPAQAAELKDLSVIQNIHIHGDMHPADVIAKVDAVQHPDMYYMLTFDSHASQESFLGKAGNQLLLTEFCRDYPVIFNFHFTPDNLINFIDQYNPFGINLRGGSEIKPGYKDFDALNELLELLEM